MAKRFTDTSLYSKKWFRRLSPELKCLWEWLRCNCDHAGLVEFDAELASFQIGLEVTEKDLEKFGNRIEKYEDGKYWLNTFVDFQYGKLSSKCRPHIPVIEKLKKYGLLERVLIPFEYPSKRVEEKEKEKEKEQVKEQVKDKEQDQEKEKLESIEPDLFDKVFQSWNDVCGKHKPFSFCKGLKSDSKKKFFEIIKLNKELKKIETWEECFRDVKSTPILRGEIGDSNWVASLTWLIDQEKIINVLNGEYGANSDSDKFQNETYEEYLEKQKEKRNQMGVA
jgi:hypothetical protein